MKAQALRNQVRELVHEYVDRYMQMCVDASVSRLPEDAEKARAYYWVLLHLRNAYVDACEHGEVPAERFDAMRSSLVFSSEYEKSLLDAALHDLTLAASDPDAAGGQSWACKDGSVYISEGDGPHDLLVNRHMDWIASGTPAEVTKWLRERGYEYAGMVSGRWPRASWQEYGQEAP